MAFSARDVSLHVPYGTVCTLHSVQYCANASSHQHDHPQRQPGGRWQFAQGQFVCWGGSLTTSHLGSCQVQEPARGQVRRDDTRCPCAVQDGSSSCQHWEGGLLPMCDIDSFYLALIDLPQCSRRSSTQGGVCEKERQKRWGEGKLVRCPLRPITCYAGIYCPVLQTASDAAFLSTFPHSLLL